MAAITWAAVVRDSMLQVGAHVSIGDGFDAAVAEQRDLGGTVGQVFAGSPRTWSVKDVDEDHRAAFQGALGEDAGPWIVHGTYLINFATPKDDLAAKSIDTVQGELDAGGVVHDLFVYPGIRPSFFETGATAQHDPDAAQLAWERTSRFLTAHLG